jgi:hypothetical protein
VPVYFIHQEERGQWLMKIGRAADIQRRLGQLQTGNPKELKVVGWIVSENDVLTERALHGKYRSASVGGEWFALQPADILGDLQAAGIGGFVAKNADAFEIVGRDRDAVPEYLGVWNWADLGVDECCPYCGCLCGMAFQEASQMFHCLHCDELTDFSQHAPDFDNEDDYRVWKGREAARKAQMPQPRPKRRFVT